MGSSFGGEEVGRKKMEPPECPECPVCLQPYDDETIIPRILMCGHSFCEPCLAHLHRLHTSSSNLPHTLRCPSCTQLVNFPGPTALPKNIDLLRFSLLLQTPNPNTKPPVKKISSTLFNVNPSCFPMEFWSEELYSVWKDWVLPNAVVFTSDDLGSGSTTTTTGFRLGSDFSGLGLCGVMRCRLVENQEVGVVRVGSFESMNDGLFEYSYVGKIMCVLRLMSDGQRNEINSILGVSLRNSRVCNVLGLWLDVGNDGVLYLVSERKKNGLLSLEDLRCGIVQEDENWGCFFGLIGVELCEVLMSLHSEGFVCGCLGLSCFFFDEFGHVCVDIGEVSVIGRKYRECVVEGVKCGQEINGPEAEGIIVKMLDKGAFVSPEVVLELLCMESFEIEENDASCAICYGSDAWLLACILIRILIGNQFPVDMYNYLRVFFQENNEGVPGCKARYLQWLEAVNVMLEPLLVGDYASVLIILLKCLDFDSRSRPLLSDVWKCIKGLNMYPSIIHVSSLSCISMKENIEQVLVLGELCNVSNDLSNQLSNSKLPEGHDDCKPDLSVAGEVSVENVVKELSTGKVQCKDLRGHLDCITGLCAGGGKLFSSSFDKTINVWSLQDFSLVHTFRGHEHKVMALVFVDQENPLCVSADSGGGIFAWEIKEPLSQEPLKKWNEEKDWRYSGVHALAVSESGCLYTGSGDRLIKAWLLRDHTLLCTMEGHKSVVSTLALYNGVLYSGSWDGTVRLWCLHDHSPLAVFSEDIPGTVSSVLSLFADQNMVIASHESGYIKVWINDVLKTSIKIHNGTIFALALEGGWLFSGGWDRTVKVQEMIGSGPQMDIIEVGSIASDSVITALLCVQGNLFVGYANKLLKVYYCGS